jgi:hypothetical protein
VWRWQVRHAQAGVDGLMHDKTRPPGRTRMPTSTVAKVMALTCAEPQEQSTHCADRAMAKAIGISPPVQRNRVAHRLQAHRMRTSSQRASARGGMADERGREAMPVVRVGWALRVTSVARLRPGCQARRP